MFGMIKKLFGNDESVSVTVESRTEDEILAELGISKEDFHSSVQDTLDLLLKTQDFDKFYKMLDSLRSSDYSDENELKRRIAEEVGSIICKKHQELLKEATQLKKQKNLDQATETIYKAINKYPTEDDRQSYFKIAYYYQLQKKWDDSWRVYQNAIDKFASIVGNDPIENQIFQSDILHEMAKHLKREKKLDEYFFHLAEAKYADLVLQSINGSKENIESFYENLDDEFIDTSLMKNEKLQREYKQALRVFLESKKDSIFKLIEYTKGKTWQRMDRDLLQTLLRDLHSHGISDFYNENLSEKMSALK